MPDVHPRGVHALTSRVRRRARAPRGQPGRVVGDHPRASACEHIAARGLRPPTSVETIAPRVTPSSSPRDAVREAFDVVVVLAGDGTLNEAADGLAGSDRRPGAAARRIDQRVRAHARRRVRPRGRRPPAGRRRSDAGRTAASDSARPSHPTQVERPLPVPPRRRLRRRHHPPDGGALLPEAASSPTPRSRSRPSTPGCGTTTARPRSASGRRQRDRRPRRRRHRRRRSPGPTRWSRTPIRTPTSATGRMTHRAGRGARRRARRHRARPSLRLAAGACGRPRRPSAPTHFLATVARDRAGRRRRARVESSGDRPVPLAGRRRLPRRGRAARRAAYRARLPHRRHALSDRCPGEVGDVGDDARRRRRRGGAAISSGSLTVQTFTCMPVAVRPLGHRPSGRPAAASTRRGGARRGRAPPAVARASSGIEAERSGRPVGTSGASVAHPVDGREVERRHQHRRRAPPRALERGADQRVHRPAGPGSLISTFTSRPRQTSRTSSSVGTLGQRRPRARPG